MFTGIGSRNGAPRVGGEDHVLTYRHGMWRGTPRVGGEDWPLSASSSSAVGTPRVGWEDVLILSLGLLGLLGIGTPPRRRGGGLDQAPKEGHDRRNTPGRWGGHAPLGRRGRGQRNTLVSAGEDGPACTT